MSVFSAVLLFVLCVCLSYVLVTYFKLLGDFKRISTDIKEVREVLKPLYEKSNKLVKNRS